MFTNKKTLLRISKLESTAECLCYVVANLFGQAECLSLSQTEALAAGAAPASSGVRCNAGAHGSCAGRKPGHTPRPPASTLHPAAQPALLSLHWLPDNTKHVCFISQLRLNPRQAREGWGRI